MGVGRLSASSLSGWRVGGGAAEMSREDVSEQRDGKRKTVK